MFIWEIGSGWDSYDSKQFRQEMEDWVIENGVTDTTGCHLSWRELLVAAVVGSLLLRVWKDRQQVLE